MTITVNDSVYARKSDGSKFVRASFEMWTYKKISFQIARSQYRGTSQKKGCVRCVTFIYNET
jgi:hypothetical protein